MNCTQTQFSRNRFLTDSWPSFSCQDGATLLADVGFRSFPAPPENESLKYDTVTSSDEVLKPEESSRTIHSIRPINKELYSVCASRLMQYFCGQSDVDSEVILPVSIRYPSVKNTSPFVHVHHVYDASTLAFVVVCEVLSDLDLIESPLDLTTEAEPRIGLQVSQEASLAIESKGVQESINQIIDLAQSTYQSLSKIHIDFYGDPEFSEWSKFRFYFTVTDEPAQILIEEKKFKKLLRERFEGNMRELLTLSYNFE